MKSSRIRPRATRLKGHKERGEWAQLCFMARAAEEGLTISCPYGDSTSYDVGVEYRGRYLRIQVKSTLKPRRGPAFRIGLIGPNGKPYTHRQIDFIAAYLISEDCWYIVPIASLRVGNTTLRNIQITPNSKRGKWHHYCEAWHLLRQPFKSK